MKKYLLGGLVGFLLAIPVTTSAYFYDTIQVEHWNLSFQFTENQVIKDQTFYNGKKDVPTSFIYEGTTYVPLRFIAEQTNTAISWDAEEEKISYYTMDLNPEESKQVSFYFDRTYNAFRVVLPKGYHKLGVIVNDIQYDSETLDALQKRGMSATEIGTQALINLSDMQSPFYSNKVNEQDSFIISNPNQYIRSFFLHFGNGDAKGRVELTISPVS